MEQHLKNNRCNKLPIVFPLVFYTGQNTYPYSMDILDLFDDLQGLAKSIYFKPFQLIEINQIPDETLKRHVWLGIMELCMKHIYARDILPHLKDMLHLLQAVEAAGGMTYIETAITYMLTAGEVSDNKLFFETIQTQLSPETGANIMTIAQQLKKEGQIEGWKEGRIEGEQEAKKAIARKLLNQGMTLENISQATDLSLAELEIFFNSLASNH